MLTANDIRRVAVFIGLMGVTIGRAGAAAGATPAAETPGASTQPFVQQLATTQPTSQPAFTVVCFGDSLTGDRPGKAYLHQYIKYSDVLGSLLRVQRGQPVRVINSGWAGDCTFPKPGQGFPGAVGRLQPDVLDHRPDIVTVLIGGNDRPKDDESRERTRRNLVDIVKRLRASGARVLALQYPPALPAPENEAKGWPLDAVNPLIAQAAAEAGVPVLDLGPAMREAARQGRTDLTNPVDGVHLAPRGELVFAETIFLHLQTLGWLDTKAD